MNTNIKYIDYYLPPDRISVQNILSFYNKCQMHKPLSADAQDSFRRQCGIEQVACFAEGESLPLLLHRMMEKLIAETGVNPKSINYICCGNEVLVNDEYSAIHYLHHTFGMNNAVILPIYQPCASSMIAMGLANHLLTAENRYMLVFTARKCRNIEERYVGFTCMGDGIAVMLLEHGSGKIQVRNWMSHSDGSNTVLKINHGENNKAGISLQMNIIQKGVSFLQKAFETYYSPTRMPELIIHPNTNMEVFSQIYCDLLNIDKKLLYLDNIKDGGHINDVDIIRNLKDSIHDTSRNMNKVALYAIDLGRSFDINYHLVALDLMPKC